MSKNTPTLLKTAAEMRSNGASWAAVGRSVGRSPRTCEQWPRLFRSAWDVLYDDAEGRRFTETGGEATAVLQGLLRDGDNKTKLRSADVLLRTRHQRLMREPATALPRPSQRPSETLGLRWASVSLAQANCPQKQLPAAESPPAVANTPIAVDLQAPRAELDVAALPTPALPTPSPTCPAPSKSRNGSLRGLAIGILLLISTLLLTALSQQQSNARAKLDSCENTVREPARYRAIPLEAPIMPRCTRMSLSAASVSLHVPSYEFEPRVSVMTPLTIIIFGASGDLTSRKLIPALFHLDMAGLLPDDAFIVGVARSPLTSESFRAKVEPIAKEAIMSMKESWFPGAWTRFAKRLFYVPGDATTAEGLQPLTDFLKKREGTEGGRRLYYLSVSPELYPQIGAQLGAANYHKEEGGFRRLVIEKPFGHDLESGRTVNKSMHAWFREDQIYRIDHYLGKETVQNILIFRFANTMFEPIWNYRYIDHVQITVAEKVPVGKRGGYYDKSGVLRDMFQSHLLQVLTMVAMENPGRYTADRLRNEKIKVLEAVRIPTAADACKTIAVGQYAGYHDEEGVPKDSRTPTYAAVRLELDNWRWRNVPFYLRSGKAMSGRYSEVVIQFRSPPHLIFPLQAGETLVSNRISLVLQPNEGIKLNFETKVPEVDGMRLQARDLSFDYREAFSERALPEAYERLLLDAVLGEAALFMRNDEIEQAWAIMDPLIAATERADAPKPEIYAPGSQGPKCGDELLSCEGRKWEGVG